MSTPRLIDVFVLTERVEHVSRARNFVWCAGPSTLMDPEIKAGFKVPAWDFRGSVASHRDRRDVEELLERVRSEEFPDAPSRDGCRFVFPDIFQAREWSHKGGMYQVEVTGKVLYTRLDIYSDLFFEMAGVPAGQAPPGRMVQDARRYWRGIGEQQARGGHGEQVECLVDGTVTVVKRLDIERVRALKDPTRKRKETGLDTQAHRSLRRP